MLLGLFSMAQGAWATMTARFRKEAGAVATEYALLIALVALAIIAAVIALATAISGAFNGAATTISGTT